MTDLFPCPSLPQGAYFPKALYNTPEWQPNIYAYLVYLYSWSDIYAYIVYMQLK